MEMDICVDEASTPKPTAQLKHTGHGKRISNHGNQTLLTTPDNTPAWVQEAVGKLRERPERRRRSKRLQNVPDPVKGIKLSGQIAKKNRRRERRKRKKLQKKQKKQQERRHSLGSQLMSDAMGDKGTAEPTVNNRQTRSQSNMEMNTDFDINMMLDTKPDEPQPGQEVDKMDLEQRLDSVTSLAMSLENLEMGTESDIL